MIKLLRSPGGDMDVLVFLSRECNLLSRTRVLLYLACVTYCIWRAQLTILRLTVSRACELALVIINLWDNIAAVTTGNQDKWLTTDAGACESCDRKPTLIFSIYHDNLPWPVFIADIECFLGHIEETCLCIESVKDIFYFVLLTETYLKYQDLKLH